MRTSEGGQLTYYQVQCRRDGDMFLDVCRSTLSQLPQRLPRIFEAEIRGQAS